MIKDSYNGELTNVRTIGRDTNTFPITIGLYQGSTLRPELLVFVMDGVTRHI